MTQLRKIKWMTVDHPITSSLIIGVLNIRAVQKLKMHKWANAVISLIDKNKGRRLQLF